MHCAYAATHVTSYSSIRTSLSGPRYSGSVDIRGEATHKRRLSQAVSYLKKTTSSLPPSILEIELRSLLCNDEDQKIALPWRDKPMYWILEVSGGRHHTDIGIKYPVVHRWLHPLMSTSLLRASSIYTA